MQSGFPHQILHVTWSDKNSLIAHYRKSILSTNMKLHECTVLLDLMSDIAVRTSLLWSFGDLYEQSGACHAMTGSPHNWSPN